MRDHILQCWGEDIWNNAKDLKLEPAKEIIRKSRTMKNIKLTEMLTRLPSLKGTFSLSLPLMKKYDMCQIYLLLCLLTSLPSVTIARWVSESMRPFHIVKDRGLQWLCKMEWPHFYLPDETTVAKDVKFLYSWSERQLAEELQVNVQNDIPCIALHHRTTRLSCIPTQLLDITKPLCLLEYFHDVDPIRTYINHLQLYQAPKITHWMQYGLGIG
jgi:hypothetical protein